jgi:hypothetical protein
LSNWRNIAPEAGSSLLASGSFFGRSRCQRGDAGVCIGFASLAVRSQSRMMDSLPDSAPTSIGRVE